MIGTVKIRTPEVSKNVRTFLGQDYTSGTVLTVDSSVSFANGNYIVVGEPGLEKTEITYLTNVPGNTTLTVSPLSYAHPQGTPVYYTKWDKYDLLYRTSSTDSWQNYAGMPADLKWDARYTEYNDSAATIAYEWRYRYFSTESNVYSDYSDAITSTGWTKNSVGFMVRNVRKIINDPEAKTVSDTEIIRYFNAGQDVVYTLYDRWWFLLKEGTVISTVASTSEYSLPSDFGRMNNVKFRYVSGGTDTSYNLRYISRIEFDEQNQDNNAADNDNVIFYTLLPGDSTNATGYLAISPKPQTAGLSIVPWYYKTFTALDSYGDETEIPVPSTLEDYAMSQIYKIQKQEGKADYYDKSFREKISLLKLLQRKQVGPPRSLWEWKGRKALQRMYGTRDTYSDATREAEF